ncbi:hypothetical protein V6N11_073084 [Hibiscus sabdariffa]|uniref:CCHC-type domain-containing protein n=2 Tax=Hibiscus sabdariffa TaxID=183260 RepID=A0ABR1ZBD2_9ROSI
MDSDSIAIQTGSSLGSLFSTVTKTDTRRTDGNMSTYLRVGCYIKVTNPIRYCVFIGGFGSSKKRCMLQYKRLPMLCYGCGLIGHLVATCTTVRLTLEIKPQYDDWLRYLPPTNLVGASRPQDKANHFKLYNFEKEAIEDSKYDSSDGASAANIPANVDPNLTGHLKLFLMLKPFLRL